MRSHGAFHRRAASKPTMCAPMLSQRNGAILNPAKKYGKSLGKHENSCTKLPRPCARLHAEPGRCPQRHRADRLCGDQGTVGAVRTRQLFAMDLEGARPSCVSCVFVRVVCVRTRSMYTMEAYVHTYTPTHTYTCAHIHTHARTRTHPRCAS